MNQPQHISEILPSAIKEMMPDCPERRKLVQQAERLRDERRKKLRGTNTGKAA